MMGTWEDDNSHTWHLHQGHFRGRCEIEIRRRLYSTENPEYEGQHTIEVAKLSLTRNDVEVLYQMMMKCSHPTKDTGS